MPPLVSVVVVNFNYARFLPEAIASVYAQTYPRIECIVVDDASSDGSLEILEAEQRRRPDLRIVRRTVNGGQSIAAVAGLTQTSGPYVVFLDADDVLLAHCVARHMQVHLTSRVHAGFTFGDAMQVVDGQVVLTTMEALADHVRASPPPDPLLLRHCDVDIGSDGLSPSDLAKKVHLVSRSQKIWVWAPTSGNCFRRDALNLICDNAGLSTLKAQTDLYLAAGVNAMTGSILIDEPVFLYRLHGTNVFSHRAQLQGIMPFDLVRTSQQTRLARSLLVDHFVENAGRFVQQPWQAPDFLQPLLSLDVTSTPTQLFAGRSHVARKLAEHFDQLAPLLGADTLIKLMLGQRAFAPAFRCWLRWLRGRAS